ncbi:endonuclease III domain-containing protein [Desulfobaculum bizertense]|uniref:DNA-3-methyladenine glycosylase III n=1 Tax=Desulfobaculum bizertense DSM 18034 TaxID=1121442 RepID=A0A1T4W7K5_9BACT|nr:endonuclease [Desulfobaculum bizertense]UIJ39142.1 endonuclease III domain-containing protein [Desulfobaculum bizertense]SKA73246.1 DNA-3-methyladenine glycosylase III [Desulfobaculum bizertense DSM 18034]
MDRTSLLESYYSSMLSELGPSQWWPGETPFEIAVGAILTQNTNWKNVAKAIDQLKAANALSVDAMSALSAERLAELIQPSGFFRLKAKRLRAFLALLNDEYDGQLEALAQEDCATAREKLLAVNGIGPETADSILLYALGQPSFVVDAYTRRILSRHGLLPEDVPYDELRDFFMDVLPEDASLFNEFHALIVRVGKQWCRKSKPLCDECPLATFLP